VILSVVVLPAYHDRRVVEALTVDRRETPGTTTGHGADVALPAPTVEPVLVRTGMFRRLVVASANRRDCDRGVRIDDLRGNSGTQFYDVPAGVDLESGPWTVLIWCQTFGVPVANATPS